MAGEAEAAANPYWPWIEVRHVQNFTEAVRNNTTVMLDLRRVLSNETTNRGVIQVVERLERSVVALDETCRKLIVALEAFGTMPQAT